MSKVKKIAKVSLIVLVSLAVLIGAAAAVCYYNITAIRFEQTDGIWFGVNIPFFCNPLLSDQPGIYVGRPFNWGLKELKVYDAVNGPIGRWAVNLSDTYGRDEIDIEYNVENDGKTIKVNFSGTAGDTPVEKEFVFDIQNASPDNLPKWTNRTEADDELMLG